MDRENAVQLLRRVQRSEITIAAALEQLSHLGTSNLGFARIDHHRQLRRGMPEVVFAEGKTNEQVLQIAAQMVSKRSTVLVTRLQPELGDSLVAAYPDGQYDAVARTFLKLSRPQKKLQRGLLVVSAGTSDLPVVQEAVVTSRAFGIHAETIQDVGVAGLHRLLDQVPRLRKAKCIVVVAGMEGALPSVVAGLVDCPVIGVPTSVGYGAALGGLTALFGMLTSCAGGLSVVNIDNGFGAACAARAVLASQAKKGR